MADGLDNPRICKTPAYSASASNLRFMVVGADASGNAKREVGTFTIDELTALLPVPQSISVSIAEQTPSFVDGQIRLPNPPTLTLRTSGAPVASGRFYDFVSGAGTSNAIYIAKNTSVVHSPIDGYQTLRWVVSKWNDTNVEVEPTNTVIWVKVARPEDVASLDVSARNSTNDAVARYKDGGSLLAYRHVSESPVSPSGYFRNTQIGSTSIYAWSFGGVTASVQHTQWVDGAVSGDYEFFEPRPSSQTTGKTKALTSNKDGVVIPDVAEDDRDDFEPSAHNRIIFNTDTGKLNLWNGTAWREINDNAI